MPQQTMQIVQVPDEKKVVSSHRAPITQLDPNQAKRRKVDDQAYVEQPQSLSKDAPNKRDQKYIKKIMDQEPLYEQKLDKMNKEGIQHINVNQNIYLTQPFLFVGGQHQP
jgi:ABC-type oligopeptide transport system ATPase subunit